MRALQNKFTYLRWDGMVVHFQQLELLPIHPQPVMISTTPWFLLFSLVAAALYLVVRRWRVGAGCKTQTKPQ